MSLFDLQCNAQQQDLIDASETLFLSPKEQANFHFMQQMRNILKSPDFMEDFETRLLKQKFADYQRLNSNFAKDAFTMVQRWRQRCLFYLDHIKDGANKWIKPARTVPAKRPTMGAKLG